MGAIDKTDFAIGKFKNAEEAYQECCADAHYQYGHDGYNGTISTSDGFRMIKEHPRYGTQKFWKFVDDTMDGTKFSIWNCIEIKGAMLKRMKEQEGYKGKRNIRAFFFWGLAAT